MNKQEYVSFSDFSAKMIDLNAIGPEIEFMDDNVTEDWWSEDETKVVGYIRYWDSGKVDYVITGN